MNELEFIQSIAAAQPAVQQEDILLGMGDDCAVLRKGDGRVLLFSMDTLVEGVHFDRAFHPPELLGHKVIDVNASDIAAMGGSPGQVLFAAGLPPGFDREWMRTFNQGLLQACQHYGCVLIGGDTVASPGGYSFTITIIGAMKEADVLYRHGAQAGDVVFASGELGLAAGGLALLRAGIAHPDFASLCARHLHPEARVRLGTRLAASGLVHAMMDSSDGLATDLAHICTASGLGARIFSEKIQLAQALQRAAALTGADALDWALCGGEDFELLFTAAPQAEPALREFARDCSLPITAIGVMDRGEGVRLVQGDGRPDRILSYQGYDHFSPGKRR